MIKLILKSNSIKLNEYRKLVSKSGQIMELTMGFSIDNESYELEIVKGRSELFKLLKYDRPIPLELYSECGNTQKELKELYKKIKTLSLI